jgi:hypothetical protein
MSAESAHASMHLRWEERPGYTKWHCTRRHRYGHERLVIRQVIQFPAVGAPARFVAAVDGITNDLDFSAILAATSGHAPSVVQIRSQDLLSDETVSAVSRAIEAYGEEVDRGALLSIDEGRNASADSASPWYARPQVMPVEALSRTEWLTPRGGRDDPRCLASSNQRPNDAEQARSLSAAVVTLLGKVPSICDLRSLVSLARKLV